MSLVWLLQLICVYSAGLKRAKSLQNYTKQHNWHHQFHSVVINIDEGMRVFSFFTCMVYFQGLLPILIYIYWFTLNISGNPFAQ